MTSIRIRPDRRLQFALGALLAGFAAVSACTSSDNGVYRPPETNGELRGAVKLIGNLSDDAGTLTGTEIVLDAAGVQVWLIRPDSSVDSTTTAAGSYGFSASVAGAYRARCQPFVELLVSSREVTMAPGGTAAFDTLVLRPSGALRTYPNPFPLEGLAIEFDATTVDSAEVIAYTLGGGIGWRYKYETPIGFNHIHWIGIDNAGAELPDGWYWLVIRYAGTIQYNLVKKL